MQALNTKHKDLTQSILVTEARDRVGGNITTVSVRRLCRSGHGSWIGLARSHFLSGSAVACGSAFARIVSSQNDEGYLWEEGPNSFQVRTTWDNDIAFVWVAADPQHTYQS